MPASPNTSEAGRRPAPSPAAPAKATRPHDLRALTVAVDDEESRELLEEWDARGISVALTVVASPYRKITKPVLDHVARIRRSSLRDVVTVSIPEFVVGHWWEQLLHDWSALRLKGRLLHQPGVMVTPVPYQRHSSQPDPVRPAQTVA